MIKKIILIFFLFLIIPSVYAAANLVVSAFSCSPNEVVINNQFICTATVENTGDATGTLNTATLYPDSTNWLEDPSYAETANTDISSGASDDVVFNGLRGKKAGYNGFSKIMLDDVLDTYVADNVVTVNVINIVVTASNSADSAASGATVDVTIQTTVGGNVDVTLTFSVTSGGCSIGNQAASSTLDNMNDGQRTPYTWTVTMGSANCVYSISAQATSDPSGTATKTDSVSGTITCSNCDDDGGTTTGGGGGGGGGGGAGLPSEINLDDKDDFTTIGYTVKQTQGDTATFTVDGKKYTAELTTLRDDSITITVAFQPRLLEIGDSVEFDVNKNGVNDISVTLKSIESGRAEIVYKLLVKPSAGVAEEVIGEPIEEISEEEIEKKLKLEELKKKYKPMVPIIIAVVLTLIIIIAIIRPKRRKEDLV